MMEHEDLNFCYYSGLPSPMAYADYATEPLPPQKDATLDRVIEMAWEDRTPFDAIQVQFGLSEAAVKVLMKKNLRFSSYKLWRKRVESCKTKHASKRTNDITRFKSNRQRAISNNKLSKRK